MIQHRVLITTTRRLAPMFFGLMGAVRPRGSESAVSTAGGRAP